MKRKPMPKTAKGIQSKLKQVQKEIQASLEKIQKVSLKIYGISPPDLPYIMLKPELKDIHKEFMYNIRRQKRLYNKLYPGTGIKRKRVRR